MFKKEKIGLYIVFLATAIFSFRVIEYGYSKEVISISQWVWNIICSSLFSLGCCIQGYSNKGFTTKENMFFRYRSVFLIVGLSIFNLVYSLYLGRGTDLGFNPEPLSQLERFLDIFCNISLLSAYTLMIYDSIFRIPVNLSIEDCQTLEDMDISHSLDDMKKSLKDLDCIKNKNISNEDIDKMNRTEIKKLLSELNENNTTDKNESLEEEFIEVDMNDLLSGKYGEYNIGLKKKEYDRILELLDEMLLKSETLLEDCDNSNDIKNEIKYLNINIVKIQNLLKIKE